MSANLSALFYLISGILFILALRGLSSQKLLGKETTLVLPVWLFQL